MKITERKPILEMTQAEYSAIASFIDELKWAGCLEGYGWSDLMESFEDETLYDIKITDEE